MTRTSNGKHQLWLLVMGMAVCRPPAGNPGHKYTLALQAVVSGEHKDPTRSKGNRLTIPA